MMDSTFFILINFNLNQIKKPTLNHESKNAEGSCADQMFPGYTTTDVMKTVLQCALF